MSMQFDQGMSDTRALLTPGASGSTSNNASWLIAMMAGLRHDNLQTVIQWLPRWYRRADPTWCVKCPFSGGLTCPPQDTPYMSSEIQTPNGSGWPPAKDRPPLGPGETMYGVRSSSPPLSVALAFVSQERRYGEHECKDGEGVAPAVVVIAFPWPLLPLVTTPVPGYDPGSGSLPECVHGLNKETGLKTQEIGCANRNWSPRFAAGDFEQKPTRLRSAEELKFAFPPAQNSPFTFAHLQPELRFRRDCNFFSSLALQRFRTLLPQHPGARANKAH
ncbi:hypothetical protein CIRG_06285 [Coccidioides immitis RMSCC 2394]|uniref:Uncharacterized protein n=1 Tax=Coccidioides immitis RMSCC 2394 TaxID=404692 RepID=A0A0J6YHR0_COCIT|nr:hypothetical protein CIRG_06285 [Coccidioides immitis RMSCC 2394]